MRPAFLDPKQPRYNVEALIAAIRPAMHAKGRLRRALLMARARYVINRFCEDGVLRSARGSLVALVGELLRPSGANAS